MRCGPALLALLLATGAVAAAPGRDIFGTWYMRFEGVPPKGAPPYNAQYLPDYLKTAAQVAAGTLDLGGMCLPPGMPRVTSYVGEFEILDAPAGRITVLHEYQTQQRRIHLNVRPPADVSPMPNGYSTGHWERNTLVVETIGISPYVFLDENAGKHSDQLKVTERFHLLNHDLMVIDTTVEDPLALTEPWKYSRTYDRTHDELIEYECNENPRNPVNADGSLGFTFKHTPR
jgi:hypothetical protein